MHKLIRVTTLPISMEKLLENQLDFMKSHFDITAIACSESEGTFLEKYGQQVGIKTFAIEFTRAITPFDDLKAILKLYKFLKKEQPTIIHSFPYTEGWYGKYDSRKISEHSNSFAYSSWITLRRSKWNVKITPQNN